MYTGGFGSGKERIDVCGQALSRRLRSLCAASVAVFYCFLSTLSYFGSLRVVVVVQRPRDLAWAAGAVGRLCWSRLCNFCSQVCVSRTALRLGGTCHDLLSGTEES